MNMEETIKNYIVGELQWTPYLMETDVVATVWGGVALTSLGFNFAMKYAMEQAVLRIEYESSFL